MRNDWRAPLFVGFLIVASFGFAESARCQAEEAKSGSWPRWRGPQSDGSSASGPFATRWSETQNLAWKMELPGIGCSTPIVWEGVIYLTCPDGDQDMVIALDWEGRQKWRTAVGALRAGKHRNGSSCNPSPVTDGQRIFAYFKSGVLAAVDREGQLLWKTNLQERYGKDTLYWDIGTSPVLTDELVVVAVMHQGESYLAAFDKATGDVVWKVARNYDCPVEGDHSYATPIVLRRQDKQVILVWGAEHVTAHQVSDGGQVWTCGGFNPDRMRNWVAVASAVVAGDTLVVPYGRGSRLAGVQLGGAGDVTATHRRWVRENAGAFVPTPAASGGNVYLLGDRGEVTCLDAQSGATRWRGELPKNRNKYYASPVVADGKIYATREDGVVFVASVAESFRLLAENAMQERMIASPVPVSGRILLRGERHLFCVQAPKDVSAKN